MESASVAAGTGAGAEGESPRRLRRDIGFVGLLFTSVGSIIGSGWLFGALNASTVAGPAAVLTWVIGGGVMLLLALVHAELGGMYPVSGGSARFPHFAFGSLIGFAGGWFAFLGAVTTAPIEVEAALQYSSNYISGLATLHGDTVVLTFPAGYIVAAALMLLFSFVNVLGVKWLAESNKAIVWWKIFIPVLTVIVLIITAFHTGNFSAGGGFMPFGLKGVFLALATGGVIFAYIGFEQAIQLGGESKNPKRNIPLAVIGSMCLGIVLYIALQIAFLGALDPGQLTKGWDTVSFTGNGELYGPFAGLAEALGLTWLATLLYTDAIISPGGTGLLYVGTSSRLSYGMGRTGYLHPGFAKINDRGVPWVAIIFSFLVGMIVFLPFPGWQQLVGFITSATVLGYAVVPLALGALRRQEPDRERPFRLPGGTLTAILAFIVANEVLLFSGWAVVWKLIVAIFIGFALLAISAVFTDRELRPKLDWLHGMWLWPYLFGMGVISYLSSFDTEEPSSLLGLDGPTNTLKFGVDTLVVAVFSVLVYLLALRLRLPPERAQEYVGDLTQEVMEEKRELREQTA